MSCKAPIASGYSRTCTEGMTKQKRAEKEPSRDSMLGSDGSGRQLYVAVSTQEECSSMAWLYGASQRALNVMIGEEGSRFHLTLGRHSRSHKPRDTRPAATACRTSSEAGCPQSGSRSILHSPVRGSSRGGCPRNGHRSMFSPTRLSY